MKHGEHEHADVGLEAARSGNDKQLGELRSAMVKVQEQNMTMVGALHKQLMMMGNNAVPTATASAHGEPRCSTHLCQSQFKCHS